MLGGTHPTEGPIVLKLIQPTQDLERIQREVLAANGLASARVPRIHEVGRAPTNIGDLIWIREQRIVGTSVRELLARGSLTKSQVLAIGMHTLETLAVAEGQHMVHRDIKPDNLMYSEGGESWLLDFGLVRMLDMSSLTQTALPFGVGTVGYAPPEQMRNRKREIDSRADIFGLGITLYECATGGNPFREGARDDLERLRRVESMTLPRLTLEWDLNGNFADFVGVAIQRHREHRQPTIGEALAWFREIE